MHRADTGYHCHKGNPGFPGDLAHEEPGAHFPDRRHPPGAGRRVLIADSGQRPEHESIFRGNAPVIFDYFHTQHVDRPVTYKILKPPGDKTVLRLQAVIP